MTKAQKRRQASKLMVETFVRVARTRKIFQAEVDKMYEELGVKMAKLNCKKITKPRRRGEVDNQ